MKKSALLILFVICASFTKTVSLQGIWQYNGGSSNGKAEGPPTQYTLQRTYTATNFTAVVLEKGYKPEKYEAGTYVLKGDTCFETTTFNNQTPQSVGKTVAYIYSVNNGIMHLASTLPGGTVVDDQWRKVK